MLGSLQKIGRALLTPIAVLPAAALLLRLGADDIVKTLGIPNLPDGVGKEALLSLFAVMNKAGGAVFENLPLLFALGVGVGLADGAGVAGLAALIGYLVLIAALNGMTPFLASVHLLAEGGKLDMGVFAGILTGAVAAALYKKYKDIQLPDFLQFFGGRRFVPIASAFASLCLGVALAFLWPPVQGLIGMMGNWMVRNDEAGVFLYGTLNRLLIPFGLHHILNSLVWFAVGDFTAASGVAAHGDLNRFFAGDPSAGIFMAGFYPVMMFGLPAACLAMTRQARPERRKAASGVLLGAALTSLLTGVTEPIEFAFMFLAPLLYLLHALLTGAALVIANLLGAKHGFGFSAGLIDYVLSYGIATRPALLLPIGAAYGALYYGAFTLVIRRFNLPTPGREPEETDEDPGAGRPGAALEEKARALCDALGGRANLASIDACITRLRLKLADERALDEPRLKAAGAAGVVRLGGGAVQAVVGTQAELIAEAIKRLPKTERVLSPFNGRAVPLESVPDEAFSQKLAGDGLAVEPSEGIARSPVAGELAVLFPTAHAFGVRTASGLEVLVHIGVNTVEMRGAGFTALKKQGDYVRAGEPVVRFDLEKVKREAPSAVSPVLITNMEMAKFVSISKDQNLKGGSSLAFEVEVVG